MAVVIPPGYAQFSVEHWLANYTRPAVTTWGASILGVPGDNAGILANEFQAAYHNSFTARIDTNVTIRSTRVVIGQDGGEPLVGISDLSNAGTSSRESVAPALALMINRDTGLGGRRNRSRCFMPWAVGDSEVSEQGAVLNSALNNWNAALTTFIGEIETSLNIGELVVLHGENLGTPTPITSMRANPVIRTQKQRQARF